MCFTKKSRSTPYQFYFLVHNLCVSESTFLFRVPPRPPTPPPPVKLSLMVFSWAEALTPSLVLLRSSSSESLLLLLSLLLSALPKYFYFI